MRIDYGLQFLSKHPILVNPSLFLVSLITRIKEALSLITSPFFINTALPFISGSVVRKYEENICKQHQSNMNIASQLFISKVLFPSYENNMIL